MSLKRASNMSKSPASGQPPPGMQMMMPQYMMPQQPQMMPQYMMPQQQQMPQYMMPSQQQMQMHAASSAGADDESDEKLDVGSSDRST